MAHRWACKQKGHHLYSAELGSVLLMKDLWQQETEQILQLLEVVLQRRARQHDAPFAQHGHPAQ